MKAMVFAFCLLTAVSSEHARADSWQPGPGHTQVPIWPGAVPDPHPVAGSEVSTTRHDRLVAGRSWVWVERVSQPTMTVYAPLRANAGAAVIVFPGGGYKGLAIDLEGTEVCDWLNTKGITCVLLKYRVPFSGPYWDDACKCHLQPKAPMALEDAQRTVGLVRLHAAEWRIDRRKIGVLGFSSGGHIVANISTHFAVAVYPGHLSLAENSIALNPDIRGHINPRSSPTFLLQNEDDDSDRVEDSVSYYMALKKSGVPVEMHLYAQGGHAFGLRRTKFPVTAWPQLVETWLGTLGVLPEEVVAPAAPMTHAAN
jgi:acetyl esterase/lipase